MRIKTYQAGFTLIEMLVAVLIVAILAAMGWSSYDRFVERMRIGDVVVLLGTVRAAQERTLLLKHHYTRYWHYLDAVPKSITFPGEPNDFFNDDRTIYYTRGGNLAADGKMPPSFAVYFEQVGDNWYMVADRVGWGGFSYTLVRDFEKTDLVCLPDYTSEKSIQLCMDVMGVDNVGALPADPRL